MQTQRTVVLDILANAMKLTEFYEPPVSIWLGHKLFFTIWKPDQMEAIMNSPHALEKDELNRYVEVVVSNGLLTASGKMYFCLF